MYTPNEHQLLIESVMTRIHKVDKLIPTFVMPELKERYERELIELKKLLDKLNESYFNHP